MATKKTKVGGRAKPRKHRDIDETPFSTPVPAPDPEVDPPKLGTALDPEDARTSHAKPRSDDEESSAGQSGSLQGLSHVERSAPESVDELLEEGNAFEAGIIAGVENAPDADQGEVRTHEAPEDDVPDEYLNPEQ